MDIGYHLSLSVFLSFSLFLSLSLSLSLPPFLLPCLLTFSAGHVRWWLYGLCSSSFICDGWLSWWWLPRPSPPVSFKQPVCTLWQWWSLYSWNAPASSSPAPSPDHDGFQRRWWVSWTGYSWICWGRHGISHAFSVYGWISGVCVCVRERGERGEERRERERGEREREKGERERECVCV